MSDSRQYQSVTLANGLSALLISDPATDVSAVSLSVRVGNFFDPASVPGLAHFTEHMLFMGSARYPAEGEYAQYVVSHGGAVNGYTLSEETNFHLRVEAAYLYGAMDRMSAAFVSPLLSHSSLQREMQAVHSEYSKNELTDERRLYQVLATQALPDHPMHHFSTGSIQTLNHSSIHHQLRHFLRSHYSANLMTLAVLGREPLSRLQFEVQHLFSHIPNTRLQPPKLPEAAPYQPGINLPSLTFLQPIATTQIVNLYFPLPAPSSPSVRSQRLPEYLLYLLAHEGPGSLVAHWRSRGVARGVNASLTIDGSSFAVLQYQLTLQPEAVTARDWREAGEGRLPALLDEVVQSVFAYIRRVRTEGETADGQRRWEEWRSQLQVSWDWQEPQDPYELVPLLAKKLQNTRAELVLDPPQQLQYEAEQLHRLWRCLSPENLMLHIASSTFPFQYERVEPWYSAPYTNASLPSALQTRYAETRLPVTLPAPNPFIPRNFSLVELDSADLDHPVLLAANDYHRLYYNQALDPRLPLSLFYVTIYSSKLHREPQHQACLLLLAAMANEALAARLYSARLTGYTAVVSATPTGLHLELEGPSCLFPHVLSVVVNGLLSPALSVQQFVAVKAALLTSLSSFSQQQVYQQALYLASLWMEEDKLSNADAVSLLQGMHSDSDYAGFVSLLADSSFVEMLGYGNVDRRTVRLYAATVMAALDAKRSTHARQWKEQRRQTRDIALPAQFMLSLPPAEYVLRSPVLDGLSRNSAVVLQLVVCQYRQVRQSVLLDMIALLLKEPAFATLRTKEQLGYIVHTQAVTRQQTQRMLTVVVQSAAYSASYLTERVLAFLSSFQHELQAMTVTQWERARSVLLIAKKMEQDSVREKGADWWQQINAGDEWRRKQQEEEEVRRMTHQDLLQLYRWRIAGQAEGEDGAAELVSFRVEMEGRGQQGKRDGHRPVETGRERLLGRSEEERRRWQAGLKRDDSSLVVFHADELEQHEET